MKKIVIPAVLGLCVLSLAHARPSQLAEHVAGEVLVKLKPGSLKSLQKKGMMRGATLVKSMDLIAGEFALLRSDAKSTELMIQELEESSDVLYAEPNFIYHAKFTQDPMYEKLWGLTNTGRNEPAKEGGGYTGVQGVAGADINAIKAWDITKGSKSVTIAVIDTGIDYNHPDLKNNMWINEGEVAGNGKDDDGNGYIDDIYGWNAQLKNGNPMDGNGHGTHCAGTIGGSHDNAIGVAGVMADVKLMGVKFLSDSGSGSLADAVVAIDYATKMNVDIMSNSWGGGGFAQSLYDAIKAASDKGIIFTAAAGNDGTNNDSRPHYPSNYDVPNVISVAAHAITDSLATFSCYGKRTVHVAAPGVNVLSSTPNNNYKVYSGTSMATPHVTGVIGLLLAKEGRRPVAEVRERLMATTVPGAAYRRTTVSGGRVDAYNLLTDTRPERPEAPSEAAWQTQTLAEPFETAHPYANNSKISKTYSFPGAKFLRLKIAKYETEANYDFVIMKDAKGTVIEKLSGTGSNYVTDYAETDSITVEFTSDSSDVKWGASIQQIQVIY